MIRFNYHRSIIFYSIYIL